MEKALRKAKSDLTLSGIGSIAFGIWYFVKTILYNLFAQDYLNSTLGLAEMQGVVKSILLGLWLLVSAFTMVLHLYVGLCAVTEGSGKTGRLKLLYLLLAGVLLLGNGYSLITNVRFFSLTNGSLLDQLCDIMLDVVRLANMAALLYAAIQTRKLTQKAEQEASVHAD